MSRGFTLLEALVAFAVLAVVLGMALQAFSGGLKSAVAVTDHAKAVAHAQNRLAVLATDRDLKAGRTTGHLEDGYHWEVEVSPRAPSGSRVRQDGFRVVDVRMSVGWGGGPDPHRVTFWTTALVGPDVR